MYDRWSGLGLWWEGEWTTFIERHRVWCSTPGWNRSELVRVSIPGADDATGGFLRLTQSQGASLGLYLVLYLHIYLKFLSFSALFEQRNHRDENKWKSKNFSLDLYKYQTFAIHCLKDKYWRKVINNVFCKRIRVRLLFCWSSDQRLELRWMRSSDFSFLDVYFPKYCIFNYIFVSFFTLEWLQKTQNFWIEHLSRQMLMKILSNYYYIW